MQTILDSIDFVVEVRVQAKWREAPITAEQKYVYHLLSGYVEQARIRHAELLAADITNICDVVADTYASKI